MIETTPSPHDVWHVLETIPDPEFGIDIVSLGLVYDVRIRDGAVHVIMTLTTPTCPSGGWIVEGAKHAVERLPGVQAVDVDLVFDPAWTPAMLREKARVALGWPKAEDASAGGE